MIKFKPFVMINFKVSSEYFDDIIYRVGDYDDDEANDILTEWERSYDECLRNGDY